MILREILKKPGAYEMEDLVTYIWKELEGKGFEAFLGKDMFCGYAKPRIQDIYLMLNRYRG